MDKFIIADSSSLISLTDSCLGKVFYFLQKNLDLEFILPPSVVEEVINRPLSIKMKAYQLSAFNMKREVDKGVFMVVKAKTQKEAEEILKLTNNLFFVRGKPLHLVDMGEAEVIALANYLNGGYVLIDERTTRMLIEAPFSVKSHIEDEMNTSVLVNEENLRRFSNIVKGIRVIRSVELISLAYEHGFFKDYKEEDKVFKAALYRLRYSGCAVRFDEIETLAEELTKKKAERV